MPSINIDPAAEYKKRLRDRQIRRDQCWSRMRLVGVLRLVTALVFIAMLWPVFASKAVSGWFLTLPVGVFALLALYHDRLFRARDRAQRAVTFMSEGSSGLRIVGRAQGIRRRRTRMTITCTRRTSTSLGRDPSSNCFALPEPDPVKRLLRAGFASPPCATRFSSGRKLFENFEICRSQGRPVGCWVPKSARLYIPISCPAGPMLHPGSGP